MVYKILWHDRPVLQVNEQLYSVPTGSNPEDKASINDGVIYITNIRGGGNNDDDAVCVWTHKVTDVLPDTTEASAILYKHQLKTGEFLKLDGIRLNEWDSVWVESDYGRCSFTFYGEEIYWLNEAERIRIKIIAGTATASEQEKYALLVWGAIQTNVNNCP